MSKPTKEGSGEYAYYKMGKLNCNLGGFAGMGKEIVDLSLLVFSLTKEIFSTMLPDNLKKAVKYAWDGALGAANWVGFALAALYYLSAEANFEEDLCVAMSYGKDVIDALHTMVDFAETADSVTS